MTTLTFVEVLKREVGKMQSAHPEREGELARAHALILQGMVVPTADDPTTAHVLSSDGTTQYRVNSHCDCQAGQHGKQCKHRQSWLLYQHIARKVEAQSTPEERTASGKNQPLPEARASLNFKAMIGGFEVQVTLRDDTEAAILDRLQVLLKRQDMRPVPKSAPRSTGTWKRNAQGR